jgi:hypothetical protein
MRSRDRPPPLLHPTNPKTDNQDAENAVNGYRSRKFSDTKCWLSDGNRQDGWRHQVCVGNYTYTFFRCKLVSTPQSCTRFQEATHRPRPPHPEERLVRLASPSGRLRALAADPCESRPANAGGWCLVAGLAQCCGMTPGPHFADGRS